MSSSDLALRPRPLTVAAPKVTLDPVDLESSGEIIDVTRLKCKCLSRATEGCQNLNHVRLILSVYSKHMDMHIDHCNLRRSMKIAERSRPKSRVN